MSSYKIIENFLHDPEEIIEYSKDCEFLTAQQYKDYNITESTGKWPGLRSRDLKTQLPEVVDKINNLFGVEIGWITFYKHLLSQKISKPMPHIDKMWDFSGVIYLEGDGGTWIDGEEVDFKYNRAVCFDAHIPHHPLHGTKDRLAITFFSKYV